MDYNQSLVRFFFKSLTDYLKNVTALYVLVDPPTRKLEKR